MAKCKTCGHPPAPIPYYEEVENSSLQDHSSIFKSTQYAAGVVIADEFQIPAVDQDIVVCVKDATNIVVGSYLWHPAYGPIKIAYWDGCNQKIGLLNEGLTGTAAPGTVVSECTAFVITSRPCCADQDNFQLFPFLAENFVVPAIGSSRTIRVTSTFGLVTETNIRIGTGVYLLEQINSSLEVVIKNEGGGETPGTTVEAKDADGDFQYLITTIIVSGCSNSKVTEGIILVCDGSSEQRLDGSFVGQVPALQDASTDEVAFVFLDADLRSCTTLTAQMAITALQPDYTIDVDDESLFDIGDVVEINFSSLRWLVLDNTTPGQLDVTCVTGNPGVTVNVASGSAVCLQLSSETFTEQFQTGWQRLAAAATYNSASSFEISGDVTARLRVGQKFKFLLNGVVYYGNIAAFGYELYSVGNTGIDLVVNTDYVLTNNTIEQVYISNENPVDFPLFFEYDINANGFALVTTEEGLYWITDGKIFGRGVVAGSSNDTFLTVDVPVPRGAAFGNFVGTVSGILDNSLAVPETGTVFLTAGSSTASLHPNASSGSAWTSSSDKGATFEFWYIMDQ